MPDTNRQDLKINRLRRAPGDINDRYKQLVSPVPLNPCPWCRGTASVFMRANTHEAVRFVGCSTVGPKQFQTCPGFMPIEELEAPTAREAIAIWQRLTDPSRKAARPIARPLKDWSPGIGPVVWWRFPYATPAYIGTPQDKDWPGYTHWTPHPELPEQIEPEDDVPIAWQRPEPAISEDDLHV